MRVWRVGHLLRDLAPQVLGAVAHRDSDFGGAEDAVQEALIAAAVQWPVEGVPRNPHAWLYQVAMRRLTDHARSEIARRRREEAAASELWAGDTFADARVADMEPHEDDTLIEPHEDDTLILLFMCCHPALTAPAAIALTLRAVGGLTTAEIARAFLVPEATMAQRISRAKQSIRTSRIPFSMPTANERAERLSAVLHVLYLIFNEGYTSSHGPDLQRTVLSDEAIRLGRLVHGLLPDEGEVTGLLALMLLTDARRDARSGEHGELIPLDEQDRTLWDRAMIVEGVALVSAALSGGSIGPYQLQGAISAVHDEAERGRGYGLAADPGSLQPARQDVGQSHGLPQQRDRRRDGARSRAGREQLAKLDANPRIRGHYRLDAVRGHLHERAGDHERAVAHYRAAAKRTTSSPERDYLARRAARLASATVLGLKGDSGDNGDAGDTSSALDDVHGAKRKP